MGTFTFSTSGKCLPEPRPGWNGRSEWEARLERCAHTQGMASPRIPEWVGREGDCPRLAQDRTGHQLITVPSADAPRSAVCFRLNPGDVGTCRHSLLLAQSAWEDPIARMHSSYELFLRPENISQA